jgi:SAM-dependent methyltransferase
MIELPEPLCVYCGGASRLCEKGAYHKYAKGHGPFDLYLCKHCSSLFTYPLPSSEEVGTLYSGFDKGMDERIAALRATYPLDKWYGQCLAHMQKALVRPRSDMSWIDIGAGDGIMSEMMKKYFPESRGVAADFHHRPDRLRNIDVEWVEADLNQPFNINGSYDLVFAITVFEHMLDPRQFLESMLALVKPGGVLYFNCPRTDSNAFRLMGRKWPYYLPGEHITVPSASGLEVLANGIFSKMNGSFQIDVKPVVMPYPLGYYLGYYLGMRKKLPLNMDLYIPTGLLECTIHRQN